MYSLYLSKKAKQIIMRPQISAGEMMLLMLDLVLLVIKCEIKLNSANTLNLSYFAMNALLFIQRLTCYYKRNVVTT